MNYLPMNSVGALEYRPTSSSSEFIFPELIQPKVTLFP